MGVFRILAALLALSGIGGLHAAAHALGGEHAHAHDEAVPHSHGHDADHHGHDVDSGAPSEARLLPSRAVLPGAPDGAFMAPAPPTVRTSGADLSVPARRSGAPPGRRVPPLPARAPPA